MVQLNLELKEDTCWMRAAEDRRGGSEESAGWVPGEELSWSREHLLPRDRAVERNGE